MAMINCFENSIRHMYTRICKQDRNESDGGGLSFINLFLDYRDRTEFVCRCRVCTVINDPRTSEDLSEIVLTTRHHDTRHSSVCLTLKIISHLMRLID